MRKIYTLTENELYDIFEKSSNEIEQKKAKKVYYKIIEDIDMSRGVHLRNMKKMSSAKKETYLNQVMEYYILDFFPKNTFIQESFDKKFTYNVLFESPNRNYRKLFEFFDFFKKAVLLECGIVSKNNFDNIITEQSFLNSIASGVKNVGKSIVGGVKNVVKKGVEIGKKVVDTVSPYIKKFFESEFAYWVPGLSIAKAGYDLTKLYQNWDKIKKMTFEDWVEAFRSFVNGVTGVAIQIVLALTGVGNIANWIVNGLLLIYDVCYQGIGKNNWNWYNIVTSAIAIVGTGAAAALFRPAKAILGGVKKAADIAPALAGGPTLTQVLPYIKSIGQNMGKIIGWVSKSFTTFTTKFPMIGRFLKPLQGAIGRIKGFLDEVVYGFKKYFNPVKAGEQAKLGQTTLQNAPTPKNIKLARTGGAHFDTSSIAKKLLATGDKTLTKKVVGKVTKIYYTIKGGDTLQKILDKFKPQGVNQNILKQLNYEHGLEIKPGHQIRVA